MKENNHRPVLRIPQELSWLNATGLLVNTVAFGDGNVTATGVCTILNDDHPSAVFVCVEFGI